ncbi:MAG: Gfo/Idh/MocA family oxidoreductase [Candidatus Omnitrophota bacterium]
MVHNHSTRRYFLKTSAALFGAPFIVPCTALAAPAPSDKVVMGFIGVGGRGTDLLKAFSRLDAAQPAAVCDVRHERREAAKAHVDERYPKGVTKNGEGCAMYEDFNELLARKDIDAVCIATPDHWHVLCGIAAAKAGKDMYIEKPLSLTIAEGRAMCEAVKNHNRIFQFGTQQRSDNRFRLACELVRNKRLGALRTIEVGSPYSGTLGDQPVMPVPEGFNYNVWLGPAPEKPYTENRVVTPYWYYISDYTIGYVSGWGVHHVDIGQWGNGTDDTGPIEIEGEGEFPKEGLCDTATAWDMMLTYANGVKMRFADEKKVKHGVKFIGDNGWIHVDRESISADPKSILESEIKPDEIHLYNSPNHQQNFIECVQSRKETICPAETAHRSTTICHLSQITMLLKRKTRWNPEIEQFIGDEDANKMISKPMRPPWHL